MGSTSFHLLVAEVCASGRVEALVRRRVHLQLGRWLGGSRRIPTRICEEAVAAARALLDLADEFSAERVLPVGTAAFRQASNGAELAASLEHAIGRSVQVLSGVEEACTLFEALRRHPEFREPCLGLDLGGGSLELARGDANGVASALTLPLGIVLLHSIFEIGDPMSALQEQKLRTHVRTALEPARASGIGAGVQIALASGGSVRALARVAAQRDSRRRAPRNALPPSVLLELCEELIPSTRAERRRMPGMNPRRVDTLPTAVVVVSELAAAFELESLTVSEWGLREGILLEAARGRR